MKTIVERIRDLLLSKDKTVSTAESITAGHLQAMLTSVSGASDVFKGGLSAYKLPVKVELLDVDQVLAEATDCVDEDVAKQMAQGALKLFKSDYSIATCGYAEIEGNQPYAFYAIADITGQLDFSTRIELPDDRVEAQKEAARLALERFADLLADEPG